MKITLATLPEATAQEVFDHIARHMLTQNAQSRTEKGNCAYRGYKNRQCAIGCIIADDEYEALMEGRLYYELVEAGYLPHHPHDDLLENLQETHDLYPPSEWRERLRKIARHPMYDLSEEVVDAVK